MAEHYCAPWCAAVTTPYPICPQLRLEPIHSFIHSFINRELHVWGIRCMQYELLWALKFAANPTFVRRTSPHLARGLPAICW